MDDFLIVGNLDCEEEWAALRSGRARTARTLTAAARRAAASASTLLRAFAPPASTLWTLAPVAPARLPEVPGLPLPELRSGPPKAIAGAGGGRRSVLAWGETPSVRALRRRRGRVDATRPRQAPPGLPASAAAPWRVPPADPEVAARVSHRAFALEIGRETGLALPGARMIDSPGALADHLRRGGAEASGGAWVVKAPLSAAGRDRVLGRSPADAERPEVRRRLETLLARHGPLLAEPWVPRDADFGCAAVVGPEGVVVLGLHRLEVDRGGRFTGVVLAAEGGPPPGLGPRDGELLVRTAEEVGRRLAGAGYSGPFGLDAYRWRDPRDTVRFRPLGEINARLTFGLVARALVARVLDRMRSAPQAAPDGWVALRLGRRPPRPGRVPGGVVPLLHPAGDAPGAWLELGSADRPSPGRHPAAEPSARGRPPSARYSVSASPLIGFASSQP